jgi:hypothetical protein
MSEKPVEPYYQTRGKELVDMLHDKGYLDQTVARQDLADLDEYLGFIIQLHCDSAARCAVLAKRGRDRVEREIKKS